MPYCPICYDNETIAESGMRLCLSCNYLSEDSEFLSDLPVTYTVTVSNKLLPAPDSSAARDKVLDIEKLDAARDIFDDYVIDVRGCGGFVQLWETKPGPYGGNTNLEYYTSGKFGGE